MTLAPFTNKTPSSFYPGDLFTLYGRPGDSRITSEIWHGCTLNYDKTSGINKD